MELDRNRYYMLGIILLLLGIQFRLIESFVLNEASTRALHRFAQKSQLASNDMASSLYMQVAPSPKKLVKPPHWLGWAMFSAGSVICLHALVLPRKK